MIGHVDISDIALRAQIKSEKILFAGNKGLKIYGTLSCTSGKRMNTINRVFFETEKEASKNNYRPCGHCMKVAYKKWKDEII